jgi:hypothetical protein
MDGLEPLDDHSRIWKYMDLAKFTSMLATRSLYFACPTQFIDPYEGQLPKSHVDAVAKVMQGLIDPCVALRDQIAAQTIPAEAEERHRLALQDIDLKIDLMRRPTHDEVNAKFGVSCWHESAHESDAMWRVYSASGQGIAIESTVGQLRACLEVREGIEIDRVRYMDFDRDQIEKGHRHYRLFIKRKSFEYEKEVRATVLLPMEGTGLRVNCDLDVLVTRVHVSPLVDAFVRDAVEALCTRETHVLNKPVQRSILYYGPDSELNVSNA